MYNLGSLRSFGLHMLIVAVGFLYKPWMETQYGATIGKMALNLKVVGHNFQNIDFKQSLLRSAIYIIPGLILIPYTFLQFQNPVLANANGFLEFTELARIEYPSQWWISNLVTVFLFVDLIVLLSDSSGQRKSWHDRIGKTYVVEN